MTNKNTQPVVRAIEIGFGTISLTSIESNGRPVIRTFSSIATPIEKTELKTSLDLYASRKVVHVDVDGITYEVGEDAHLSSKSGQTHTQILNDSYVDSPQYKALFLGSLYMVHAGDDDVIDLLVLGLPVNHFAKRKMLIDLAKGEHKIGNRTITIKEVMVLPQPLGGLLAYANSIGQDRYQSEFIQSNTLCIDVGTLTLDHIVSRGLTVNSNRSGAVPQGVSVLIKELQQAVSKAFSLTSTIPHYVVDDALWRHPGMIRVRGKSYPFPVCTGELHDGSPTTVRFDFRPVMKKVTSEALIPVQNSIGDGADIDRIVAVGGPIEHYKEAIKNAFPEHDIVFMEQSLTAVCEGLFYAGKHALKQKSAA
jgi:plasmid segregation protein ParM